MAIQLSLQTFVLGPKYPNSERVAVVQLSAHWMDGAAFPNSDSDIHEALLQPWRWKDLSWTAYARNGPSDGWREAREFEPRLIAADTSAVEGTANALITKLQELFDLCRSGSKGDRHQFSLHSREMDPIAGAGRALDRSDAEESPDGLNHQFWPEILADAQRWPGLLPYELNLCFAVGLGYDLQPNQELLLLPRFSVTVATPLPPVTTNSQPQTTVAAEPDGLPDPGGKGRFVLKPDSLPEPVPTVRYRAAGSSKPSASDDRAVLDLTTLWLRSPEDLRPVSGRDWVPELPRAVSDVLDRLSLILGSLAGLAVDPKVDLDALFAGDGNVGSQRETRRTLAALTLAAWQAHYSRPWLIGPDGDNFVARLLHDLAASAQGGDSDPHAKSLRELAKSAPVLADTLMERGNPALADLLSELNDAIKRANRARSADSTDGQDLGVLLQLPDSNDTKDRLSAREFVLELGRSYGYLVSSEGVKELIRERWAIAIKDELEKGEELAGAFNTGLDRYWGATQDRVQRLRHGWATQAEATLNGTPLQTVVDEIRGHEGSDAEAFVHAMTTVGGRLVDFARLTDDLRRDLEKKRDQILVDRCGAFLLEGAAVRGERQEGMDDTVATLADFPPRFGDPWPLERAHAVVQPVDRIGTDTSDGDQDLTTQISGVGVLIAQWKRSDGSFQYGKSLATAKLQFADGPHGLDVLAGKPLSFSQSVRQVAMSYEGESWFEESVLDGQPESTLIDLRWLRHSAVKLPDLKFGQFYRTWRFLLGPGNALPTELVWQPAGQAASHPAVPKSSLLTDGRIDDLQALPGYAAVDFDYLRRVQVSAPNLRPTGNSSPFVTDVADVHPLAKEVVPEPADGDLIGKTLVEAPVVLLVEDHDRSDWNPSGLRVAMFQIEPPQVERDVWVRQLRGVLARTTGAAKETVGGALRQGLAAWFRALDSGSQRAPSFDDPALDGYRLAARCEYGLNHRKGQISEMIVPAEDVRLASEDPPQMWRRLTLELRCSSTQEAFWEKVKDDDGFLQGLRFVGAMPGEVWAVSVQALVKKDRFAVLSLPETGKPLSEGVEFAPFLPAAGWIGQIVKHDRQEFVAFSPSTIFLETASNKLPTADDLMKTLEAVFDGRQLRIDLKLPGNGPAFANIQRFTLKRQRWTWSGRHSDVGSVDTLVPTGSAGPSFEPKPDPAIAFEHGAFLGRDRANHEQRTVVAAANTNSVCLLAEDLDSERQAQYFRFSVEGRSRYAGLMKDPARARCDGFDAATPWKRIVLRARPLGPPPAPKVSRVLPLMGGVANAGNRLNRLAVLVQLEEGYASTIGFPERLVAEVRLARHFDRFDGTAAENYGEFGFDPILPGPAERERPRELTLDVLGPIGHSFEPDAGSSAYWRRASWIIQATADQIGADQLAWTMARIRLARELPKGWCWPEHTANLRSEWADLGWVQMPRPSDQIHVSSDDGNTVQTEHAGNLSLSRKGQEIVVVARDARESPLRLCPSPESDATFAVISQRRLDARGLGGTDYPVHTQHLAGGIQELKLPVDGVGDQPLRLRVLTLQLQPDQPPEEFAKHDILHHLFDSVEPPNTDAIGRLLTVSQAIEERE